MTIEDVILKIKEVGIVPVVRAASVEEATRAVEAICAGGIPVVEITMTVPNAVAVIREVAKQYGSKVLIGAGTVTSAEQAESCIRAGAEFLVSPSLNLATIEMANRYSKVITPGALTPTEVLTAWQAGGDIIKIFPCGAFGGAKYIKALRAPFPQIEMMPTGGVSLETVGDFLKAGACAVAVGAELIDSANIRDGHFGVFEERAKRFLEAVAKARPSR